MCTWFPVHTHRCCTVWSCCTGRSLRYISNVTVSLNARGEKLIASQSEVSLHALTAHEARSANQQQKSPEPHHNTKRVCVQHFTRSLPVGGRPSQSQDKKFTSDNACGTERGTTTWPEDGLAVSSSAKVIIALIVTVTNISVIKTIIAADLVIILLWLGLLVGVGLRTTEKRAIILTGGASTAVGLVGERMHCCGFLH